MDEGKEGLLLIATATVLLLFLLIAVLSVMLIYRRRRIQHLKEITTINEKYQREILQTQVEVQQETMSHIGREIHDNVGHQLTLAFLYLQSCDSMEERKQITEILNQALSDLRSLSSSLINNDENKHDLSRLLELECKKLASLQTCTIHFSSNIQTETPAEINRFILRIVQEFTQNSLKHAQCTELKVSLEEHNETLTLLASDNGIGFELHKAQGGIGLLNMRKRAEMIGAEFFMDSQSNLGTHLKLQISLEDKIA